ncbi:polyketide cyclase-dehydrase protein [Halorhabdus tiamatea SARL4B]|uniref:Polyketide cyclase-dehydrase protein n=1 Tax=Halorhabdus tiamatea SARL4B TaxID=1033806 RepID=F7PHT0_9EURY|nr:SRPBCC family protein [Halorhabdus tiamatea]ERJ06924.1 polyketide cyclase-dehydrase protein [Halorhabdus tiamatea SARL4B]CCQ32374.1 polyketide cyclase/dehydrase [Halorhabdus tiamatea SARL4B]
MSLRLEHVIEVSATPEEVWRFIADPEQRARYISVVEDYTIEGDRAATWEIALPIPVIDSTITVKTEDVERRDPEFVKFVGRSRAVRVVGEHELTPTEAGTRLTNTFTVEGRLPGVERFFKKNLEAEFENLEDGLEAFLAKK